MAEIQRYEMSTGQCDDGLSAGGEYVRHLWDDDGRWVYYTHHLADKTAALEAQAEEHRSRPMTDKQRGLYQKFVIERTDGRSAPGEKHDGCEYFVLDLTHDPCAVIALRGYINACRRSNPQLAEDLTRRINMIVLGFDGTEEPTDD